jgi:molybdopterin molybdotransferase
MSETQSNFRIDVDVATSLIDAHMPQYPTEIVALEAAPGSILRQQVVAERDQPPFDRVTMDGIAIRAWSPGPPTKQPAAGDGQRMYRVRGIQAAGAPAMELGDADNCVEIMTGAILPADADTVIPVERIRRDGDQAILEPGYEPTPGQFIHRQASDHAAGIPLLESGITIGAPEMAVLTIAGSATVEVARWPKIAVISTGDELIDAGGPIEKFQIRSSNGLAIAAALEKRGCTNSERAHLLDDPKQLRLEIGRLHERHEVLILSGGVSMGKYDYVPQIMSELNIELVFHKILQRPGLPMWFGISAEDKPVFALPGNPVSSLVCLARYVLPAIRKAMGAVSSQQAHMQLAEPVDFEPDLTYFLPVTLSFDDGGELHALPKPTNTSGDFVSLAGTDGIVELLRSSQHFPRGYVAPFYAW